MSGSPIQVVAHRGSSHQIAEHTLAAYVAALDEGADGLECDVRLTSDGHLVCVHDRTLRRTTSRNGLVSTTALADLEQLDFASWKNPWADGQAPVESSVQASVRAPDLEPDPDRTGVLTLRRLLETAADYGRRVELAIETKHPTRYSGLVEQRVARLLAEFAMDVPRDGERPRARVMSFSTTALQRMQRLAPAVPCVQLVEKPRMWRVLKQVVRPDWIIGPDIRLLREKPKLAAKISRAGHALHVWTVDTPADLELCRSLGVEAVITNRPAYLLDLVERGPEPLGGNPSSRRADPGPAPESVGSRDGQEVA